MLIFFCLRAESGDDFNNRSRASSYRGNQENSAGHGGNPEQREESSASSLHSEDHGDRVTFSKSIINQPASQVYNNNRRTKSYIRTVLLEL